MTYATLVHLKNLGKARIGAFTKSNFLNPIPTVIKQPSSVLALYNNVPEPQKGNRTQKWFE